MKLKRILAFAVSLAMVLSIIPAFEITAGAATSTADKWYAVKDAYFNSNTEADGTATNAAELGGGIFAAAGTGWSGGTGSATSNFGSARNAVIGYEIPAGTNPEEIASATLYLHVTSVKQINPGATLGVYQEPITDWTESNCAKEVFGATSIDANFGTKIGETSPAINVGNSGKVAYNNWVTVDVTDYVKSKADAASTAATPISVRLAAPGGGIGISSKENGDDVVSYISVKYHADVTVNYVTAAGTPLATRTVAAATGDTFTVTNTVNDNYIIIDKTATEDGYIATLISSETATVAASGTTVKVTVKPVYTIKSANLLPDGEDGIDSWTVGTSSADNFNTQPISNSEGTVSKTSEQVHSGSYAVKTASKWENGTVNGWRGNRSIAMYANVNPDSKYYFAGAFYPGGTRGTQAVIATLATAGDPKTIQGLVEGSTDTSNGGVSSWSGTSENGDGTANSDGGKIFANMNGKWNQLEYVLTTDANSAGFAALFYFLLDCGTSYFDDFMLYEVEDYTEDTTSAYDFKDVVKLPRSTRESLTLPAEATLDSGAKATLEWTSSDTTVMGNDGSVINPEQPVDVTLTEKITYNGTTYEVQHTVMVFPASRKGASYTTGKGVYDISATATNIISANGTAASFEEAGSISVAGWTNTAGNQIGSPESTDHWFMISESEAAAKGGSNQKTIIDTFTIPEGSYALGARWNDGVAGGLCTIQTYWPVEAGKSYYFSFYAKTPNASSTGEKGIYAYFLPGSTKTYGKVPSELGGTAFTSDKTNSNGQIITTTQWQKYEFVYTPAEAGFIGFLGYNLGTSAQTGDLINSFDDFELYEATKQPETVDSISPKNMTINVISGNEPVLPKSVTAWGNMGSDLGKINITEWVKSNETADGYDLVGAVEGSDTLTLNVRVNIATKTFDMKDIKSYAGQSGGAVHYFPSAISGSDIAVEFDAVFHKLVNSTITIGDADANMTAGGQNPVFGGVGDAISIQTNSGGVNVRSWSNGTEVSNNTTPVTLDKKYRFYITADTGTDKWSAVMTDEDGTQTTIASGAGFRAVVDKLDSITVLDNNGTKDAITVSGIKVHSGTVAETLQEYQVNFNFVMLDTDNNEVPDNTGMTYPSETVMESQTAVEALPANTFLPHYEIPYIPGYVFVDYTTDTTNHTYNLTYAQHIDTPGTWFTRSNLPSDAKGEPDGSVLVADLNMIGAHDAFTAKMVDKVADAAAAKSGDSGAKAASSLITSGLGSLAGISTTSAQTQDATPARLLRKGVRYFDVRLSISDKADTYLSYGKGTNGEFYTTHAYLCQPFKTILYQIRDICEENKGEVIILDFQEIYDALDADINNHYENASTASKEGQTTVATYRRLAAVIESVLGDYLVRNDGNKGVTAENITYNSATNGGTRAGVICIGKAKAFITDPADDKKTTGNAKYVFIKGGDRNNSASDADHNESSIYSYYNTDVDGYGSLSDMANGIAGEQMQNSGVPKTRFMVMQAIYGKFGSEGSNLLKNGEVVARGSDSDPTCLMDVVSSEQGTDFMTWIRTMNIVMVNNADEYRDYVDLLAEYNRDTYDQAYRRTSNGVTLMTAAGKGEAVPVSTDFSAADYAEDTRVGTTETIGGTDYTFAKAYDLTFTRYGGKETATFDATKGSVELVFPGVSTGKNKDNVVLWVSMDTPTDTPTVLGTFTYDQTIEIAANDVDGIFYIATVDVPTYQVGIQYVDVNDNSIVYIQTEPAEYREGEVMFETATETTFYLKGNDTAGNTAAHILKSKAQTIKAPAQDGYVTVPVTMEHKYAVLADRFANEYNDETNSGTDNNILLAAKSDVDNPVGTSRAPATDADGEATYTAGSYIDFAKARAGLMEFAIDEEILSSGAVYLNLYVYQYKSNGPAGKARIAAYTVNNSADLEAEMYKHTDSVYAVTSEAMFAIDEVEDTATGTDQPATPVNKYVKIDVTEAVKKALGAGQTKITFKLLTPVGGVYIAERENTGIGGGTWGDYEGKAAYLDTVTGRSVTVSNAAALTKNGSSVALTDGDAAVTVTGDSSIKVTADAAKVDAFIDSNNAVYRTDGSNGTVKAFSKEALATIDSITGYKADVKLVDGAQVRIGQGVDANNKIATTATPTTDSTLATSGLRFIGVIDSTVANGLAALRETIGATLSVKITAEGADGNVTSVEIPIDKFQNDTTFTAALVNLKESNYNRVFTATPYITVGTEVFEGSPVSRSIYEVAAGVLSANYVEGNPGTDGTGGFKFDDASEIVRKVLNAYVNQVGIRLKLTSTNTGKPIDAITATDNGKYQSGRTPEEGATLFFEVTSSSLADGLYTVNIKPVGNAQIFDYWNEYIRLNNAKLEKYITNADTALGADGTLTLIISTTPVSSN